MPHEQSSSRPSSALDRRTFLQTSAVTVGALTSQLSMAQPVHTGSDETLRVALIGCGGRGTQAAMQTLQTPGPAKLVAMADVFEDRLSGSLKTIQDGLAEKAATTVDVPPERQFVGFDAYQKALAEEVDVVVLATPPGFRPLHFTAAIDAGKHVFMEKPVAVDAPGVRAVLAAGEKAKEKNLCVGVGLQRRHSPMYLETIKMLQDGAIGDLLSMHAYWVDGGVWVKQRDVLEKQADRKLSELEYQMRNWYYFTWICGDHIVEQHIHNMDVINWVKDAYPVRAQGQGGRIVRTGPDHGQIYDHHMVEFTYEDGSTMHSQCRHIRNCWNNVSEKAIGSRGEAQINRGRIVGEDRWRFRGRNLNPYQKEIDDLFAAIRSSSPYSETEFGAKSTMTAILGRMATYSGQLIQWDDALNSDIELADTGSLRSFDDQAPVLPDDQGKYPIPLPGVTETV